MTYLNDNLDRYITAMKKPHPYGVKFTKKQIDKALKYAKDISGDIREVNAVQVIGLRSSKKSRKRVIKAEKKHLMRKSVSTIRSNITRQW